MRFLIDMNLSPKWVDEMAKSDIEAIHWAAIGSVNAGDPEIMAFAKVYGYVVLTNDLDFGSILAATQGDAPSVIQLRTNDCRVETIGEIVLQSIAQAKEQLETGALVTIETSKMRITSLPIGFGR